MQAHPAPHLRIHLFGKLRIYTGQYVIPGGRAQWPSVLAYLLLHPNLPHRREALADILFPDAPPDRARRTLSYALHRMRKALGDDDVWLTADGDSLSVTTSSVWLCWWALGGCCFERWDKETRDSATMLETSVYKTETLE
jgi:hypothetical protein